MTVSPPDIKRIAVSDPAKIKARIDAPRLVKTRSSISDQCRRPGHGQLLYLSPSSGSVRQGNAGTTGEGIAFTVGKYLRDLELTEQAQGALAVTYSLGREK